MKVNGFVVMATVDAAMASETCRDLLDDQYYSTGPNWWYAIRARMLF
jgi:hypothetical protein